MRRVKWDKVYGTNFEQVGPNVAKVDQLGQVGSHIAVLCLLGRAIWTNLDQVGLSHNKWDKVYGTNFEQVGPNVAKLDQLGQVGRHIAALCLLGRAIWTNLDQVGLSHNILCPTEVNLLHIPNLLQVVNCYHDPGWADLTSWDLQTFSL